MALSFSNYYPRFMPQINRLRDIRKISKRCCSAVASDLDEGLNKIDARGLHVLAQQPRQSEPLLSKSITKTANNIVTMSTLANETLKELYGTDGTVGIAKWRRFDLLNKYLHGFRLGELTILTGPTGSGKTTFLSEYSLDLATEGVQTLWCNFELKNSKLLAMMLRQYYSTNYKSPLDPAAHTEAYMRNLMDQMYAKVPICFATFTGGTNVDKVLKAILEQHEISPLQHVVVDNLQFMLGASSSGSENPFAMQDSVYSKFRKLATEKNIHITMVIHPRKFGDSYLHQELSVHSLYGGVRASQEADNILIIQVRRTDEDFIKYLQIAKNRYFGDTYLGNELRLAFHKESQRHKLFWPKEDRVNWRSTNHVNGSSANKAYPASNGKESK